MRKRIAGALAATLAVVSASEAHAGGLYFSDRGVRPLGRGGAFVAGADDLGAIWYNPAGLADAGSSLLLDMSWLNFSSNYTRQTAVTSAGGTVSIYEFPTVQGTTPFLPIPTLGASINFGEKKEYTVAFGVYAPYTPIASYPMSVNGQPAPSRYSLVSLDGSALVVTGAYFAWKPVDAFRIGGGLEALVGNFNSTVVFSASPPDRLVSSPEDATYDAMSQLKVGPIFAPSANLGITVVPMPSGVLRFGLSGQLPFHVDAPATVNVRLPTAPEFDKASQQGQDAHVAFNLPGVVRLGAEVRPVPALRVEAAWVHEFWGAHSSIDITPTNIELLNITGFPSPFGVAPIHIPRNFQDSDSFRLGGEYTLPVSGYKLDLRAGLAYETSAIPPNYVSPLTIDTSKVTIALGGSLHVGKHWRLDAVYAHVFASDLTVDPNTAAVPRVNPVQGNPTATEAINGGKYSARADVLGVGVEYRF